MAKIRRFLVLVAASALVLSLAPSAAHATNTATGYQYFPNQLSQKYKYTQFLGSGGACYYRIRFGNYGSVGYAQIRFYAGSCGGATISVLAASGSVTHAFPQDSARAKIDNDSCGSYIELQSTSPSGYIALGMLVYTQYRYIIEYSNNSDEDFDTPVEYCG
jgi:hypothetical protein